MKDILGLLILPFAMIVVALLLIVSQIKVLYQTITDKEGRV